jgi:hypothetical protein
MAVKKQVFAEVEAVVSPECVLATNTSSLSITEMASDLEHPGAGRGLPLLQPGRGHAAARDHPRREDRRRRAGHGVRHRQGPEEDASWSRTAPPSSSTACSAGSWASSARSSTRAPRSRSPTRPSPASRRCRRSSCWAGRPGHRPAQQRDPAPGLPGPVLRLAEPADGSSRPASRLLPREGGKPGRPTPRCSRCRSAGEPGRAHRRAGPRAGPRRAGRGGPAHAGRGRRRQAPMDIDLAMITGAGFQFWNGGL